MVTAVLLGGGIFIIGSLLMLMYMEFTKKDGDN